MNRHNREAKPSATRGARVKDALIVDDHPIVRAAIKDLLEKSFPDIRVTEFDGSTSVVNKICGGNWAFVVLDINLPKKNGLDILKAVKVAGNHTPIVVFSLYAEEHYAARALRAGAKAYISKNRASLDLVNTINTLLKGGRVKPSPSVIAPRPVLSDREIQVLSLLTKGMSRKEVAQTLNIHEKTVSSYRARILVKLNARTLVDLIHYATEEGFVD
ncbi:MAG TPA: response regulator transcription factor [Nitrospiraceae bacterium]|nr:response regulator transcription factor [Nitrospiraceae bacterium]